MGVFRQVTVTVCALSAPVVSLLSRPVHGHCVYHSFGIPPPPPYTHISRRAGSGMFTGQPADNLDVDWPCRLSRLNQQLQRVCINLHQQ